MVKLLLKHSKINVNTEDIFDGDTALIWASFNGHENVVDLLLQNPEIDLNSKNYLGNTALIYAARNGYEKLVMLLLRHAKIDVNSKNQYGKNALDYARLYGREEIIELLKFDYYRLINILVPIFALILLFILFMLYLKNRKPYVLPPEVLLQKLPEL